jgi:hypothetical protein
MGNVIRETGRRDTLVTDFLVNSQAPWNFAVQTESHLCEAKEWQPFARCSVFRIRFSRNT